MIGTTTSRVSDHCRRARLTFSVSGSEVRRIAYVSPLSFQAAIIRISFTCTDLALGAVRFLSRQLGLSADGYFQSHLAQLVVTISLDLKARLPHAIDEAIAWITWGYHTLEVLGVIIYVLWSALAQSVSALYARYGPLPSPRSLSVLVQEIATAILE
jgi:hypothetical protein